jgi:hypothetical protein
MTPEKWAKKLGFDSTWPFKPTKVETMNEQQTLTADEASTFHEIVCAFDLDGESQHDTATLLDYASRGLLRCVHFEVTDEGRAALLSFYGTGKKKPSVEG